MIDKDKERKRKTKSRIIFDISEMMKGRNVRRELLIEISGMLRRVVPGYRR